MWKARIAGFAAKEIAKLPHNAGTNAEVVIDSGSVPELLNRAAEQGKGRPPGRRTYFNRPRLGREAP